MLFGDSIDEKVEDEPFKIEETLIKIIAEKAQVEGVEVVCQDCHD